MCVCVCENVVVFVFLPPCVFCSKIYLNWYFFYLAQVACVSVLALLTRVFCRGTNKGMAQQSRAEPEQSSTSSTSSGMYVIFNV